MIKAQGIGRKGLHGNWLWRNLNMALKASQMVGLMGRNGTGKTTLIRTLLGLVQPHEGRITAPANIGYVPQNSQITFPFTVRQIIAMGRARHVKLFSSLSSSDHSAIDSAITQVGIHSLSHRSFHELSGGERQLTLIARAIASDCKFIILDEPFSGLDLDNQAHTLSLLCTLASDSGIGVLFSTHQPDHLFAGPCDALVIQEQKECILGPAQDILTEPLLSQVYQTDVKVIEVNRTATTTRHAVPNFKTPHSFKNSTRT
jgi:iron complex transport system ATP-binding protein